MDFDKESDQRVRKEAFSWLGEQVSLYGETLPREILAQGFQLDGQRVPLLGPQGIFKPLLTGCGKRQGAQTRVDGASSNPPVYVIS